MNDSAQDNSVRPSRHRRPSALAMWTAAATLVFATLLAAIAFAGGTSTTVDSASNAALGEQVLVSAQGHTLYALSPETSTHLLCKSSECLKLWPPLTVPSRTTKLKAGAGVHGTLGILRRAGGTLQVTLRGVPLYRFAGDRAKSEANGQGIKSFGGTWHAVTASSSPSSSTPSKPPSTSTTPGYEY
jgi:predicted lipoprotein with Yx(FWY)xxD motif